MLRQEESSTLDFKREIRLASDKDKFEFAKDLSAFANTKGGYVVYGKEDKSEGGRIIGINPQSYDADQMQQIIAQRCNPPPVFTSKMMKAKRKWFVTLEIPESELKPVELIQNRDVWIRRGATSDKATEQEREQMRPRRGKRTLEERLASEGISEESENWLRRAMIHWGRRYIMRVHGKLDISIRKELLGLALLGVLCCVPIFYSMLEIAYLHSIPSQEVLWFSIILTMVGMVLFYFVDEIPKLYCTNCKRQFAIRRTMHNRVKDKILHSTEEAVTREVIYRDVYVCEFCRHRQQKFEPTTETIQV